MTMFRKFTLTAALVAVAPTTVSSQGFALLGEEILSPLPALEVDGSVFFGTIVSLSADGKRMAVGAPDFDYSLGIGQDEPRNDAGAVFLYELLYSQDTQDYTWASLSSVHGQESEGLGRYLWLSPDGQRVAVRRGVGTVQVYSTDTAAAIGSIVTDCLGGAVELTNNYLVTSCDRFDVNRGKVQVHQLSGDGTALAWELVVEIEGSAAGDRFGWRTALDETAADDNRLFTLAVSAPNHDSKTGLVRSYIVDPNGDYEQFGQDLTGDEPAEQFGFSIAMSRLPNALLAVGVPQAAAGGEARGAIRIYNYGTVSDEWAFSAEFAGPEDRNRLGRDVAISANGDRAAASTFRPARLAGLVTVYERIDGTNFEELSAGLVGENPQDRFGNNVALSQTGSIIASGSINRENDADQSVGSVRVFVDRSPFCSDPLGNDQAAVLGSLGQDAFLERQTCRIGSALVTTAEACSTISCDWQETAAVTGQPTASPATDVSTTNVPTASPTMKTARPEATTEPEVPLPWSLEACACDNMGNCIEDLLAKGVDLGICIRVSRDEINLVNVENFRIEQGSSRVVIIDETGLRVSSASTDCTGSSCVIRTPVDATFFSIGRPDSLVASGTIAVAFSRTRSLRGAARELDEPVTGDFRVNVALIRDDDEDDDEDGKKKNTENETLGLSSPVWIVMFFMVALIIGCCCCATADSQGESREYFRATSTSKQQGSEKELNTEVGATAMAPEKELDDDELSED